MKIEAGTLQIDGAPLGGVNPLPAFRETPYDKYIIPDTSMNDEDCRLMGYETAKRVLPYGMQDCYGREKRPLALKTVVLENDRLKAVFLPEYGARLYSLFDKKLGRELFFKNPVFQPANLSQRNAWFSGGIEWNVGHYGHSTLTCEPLFAAIVRGDKSQWLRFYEFERSTCVFYQMDFYLDDDMDTLAAYVKIINHNDHPVSTYWWTNSAARLTEKTRVLAGESKVICAVPRSQHSGTKKPNFCAAQMPYLPAMPGADSSFPASINFSNEYFFQYPQGTKQPWEASLYEDGQLTFETSTEMLRYRKMFCWGNLAGGQNWMDFLSRPGEGDYVEIQAGLAPTQLHGYVLPEKGVADFTQVFGCEEIEPKRNLLESDWAVACGEAERLIWGRIPADKLSALHEKNKKNADNDNLEIIFIGSGWGALERLRLERSGLSIPAGLRFPDESITTRQQPWLELLKTGKLSRADNTQAPDSWMVQKEWAYLLSKSLFSPRNRNWFSLLHMGVMLYELGDKAGAADCWGESLTYEKTQIAYRNLAYYAAEKDNPDQALAYMEEARALKGGFDDLAYDEELLHLYAKTKQYEKLWEYYTSLSEEKRENGRIKLRVAYGALILNKQVFLDAFFQDEFATLREAETSLTDLWYLYMARKQDRDTPIDQLKIDRSLIPPKNIEFRLS